MLFHRPFFGLLMLGLFVAFAAPNILHRGSLDDSPDTISDTAVLGGVDRRVQSDDFRGGYATAILGGVKLDLRDVQTTRDEVSVDLTSFMGGVEVIVPRDWDVRVSGNAILGGFEDKSSFGRDRDRHRTRLLVRGTAILGGVNVHR